MFKKIEISYWRQFEQIDIDIDSKITIITGSNGAGKTTLLGILNQHFGWNPKLLSTPTMDEKTGGITFLTGWWKRLFKSDDDDEYWSNIGKIFYENETDSEIRIPKKSGSSYSVDFSRQSAVRGMHIPSHRPVYSYKEVEAIPTRPKRKEDYFNEYNSNIINKFTSEGKYVENISASYLLKQSLIGLATFGYGNAHVVANQEYAELFEGFGEVLRKLLPITLGFKKLEIRIPEVVLVTNSGDFSIDAASGGVASIIGLAWQIFMFAQNKERYVITIDEPENHLHPSMQRELIPNLLSAFPNAQFVVATHSPFIIGSSKESSVYALAYNEDNRVFSRKLDMIDKSGSAAKVLREVLGVPVTVPVWVENEIQCVIEKYSKQNIDETTFERMRNEMKEKGLEEFMPNVVTLVVEAINDKDH